MNDFDHHDTGTGRIKLTRPKKLNSLSNEMIHDLTKVYTDFQTKGKLASVWLEGEGRAFCAGGDVDAIRTAILDGTSTLPQDFFYDEYKLNHLIASLNIPHISIWDGFVMGGGVGLSVHGTYRVCTENTMFAMPETAIGLFPDVGGTFALPRVKQGLPMGLYIGLTGVRLKASDLMYTGLATHYIASEKLSDLANEISKAESSQDVDKILNKMCDDDVEEEAPLSKNADAIASHFGHDTIEDIAVSLIGDESKFSEKAFTMLSKMSPLSLKVTFEALKVNSAKDRTLAEALGIEYRLSQRFMREQPHSDFCEGIRAVLVDKDHEPKWAHETLSDVSEKQVRAFFEPLDADHSRGELKV